MIAYLASTKDGELLGSRILFVDSYGLPIAELRIRNDQFCHHLSVVNILRGIGMTHSINLKDIAHTLHEMHMDDDTMEIFSIYTEQAIHTLFKLIGITPNWSETHELHPLAQA